MNSFLIVAIRFTQNRLLFIKSQSILFLTTILVPVILVLYFSFKMESYFWGQLIGLFFSIFCLTTGLIDFFNKYHYGCLTLESLIYFHKKYQPKVLILTLGMYSDEETDHVLSKIEYTKIIEYKSYSLFKI